MPRFRKTGRLRYNERMFGRSIKRTYLDFAATTPILPEAIEAWRAAAEICGNPSSIHTEGVHAHERLEEARRRIARELACKSGEVYFTSGATEGNNLVILGVARSRELSGVPLPSTHWITSSIEHACVLQAFREIERRGGRVSYVNPDASGRIRPEKVIESLTPETVLVSIGWANSETGVVQRMSDMAAGIRAHEKKYGVEILFHTDAGQAPLYKNPHVHTLGVDALVCGAHKLYGPSGAGFLFYGASRAASRLVAPVSFGGGQESGMRAGTEDVPGALAAAAALSVVSAEREAEAKRVRALRDELARGICADIPGAVVNGDMRFALPHMLNVSIPDISAEYVALALDAAGIAISTKSACHEGEERGSHVIAALAKSDVSGAWRASGALRFSLGRTTAREDIVRTIRALKDIVSRSSARA